MVFRQTLTIQERTLPMRWSIKCLTILFLILLPLLWSGCRGGQVPLTPPVLTDESPQVQYQSLESDLADARQQQVDVLAPATFEEANADLVAAGKAIENGAELSKIMLQISYGRTKLQKAQERAQIARTVLDDVIKARDLAIKAGAEKLGKDYDKVENDFLELTHQIEQDNLSWVQRHKIAVTSAFDQLELRAIKDQALSKVRETIAQAKAEKAAEFAPQTLALTETRLQEVDEFITGQRYAREEIAKRVNEAQFQADRLLQITRASQQFKTMKPEETVLYIENLLYQISNAIEAPDLRNEPFATQEENIERSVAAMRQSQDQCNAKIQAKESELKATQQEIKTMQAATQQKILHLEDRTREEQAEKERLAAEKRISELYTKVQGLFSSDEAEVYQQGGQMIIRLKAMHFPVGQAVIMPENYSLLSKVQQAIGTFNNPMVTIEGHTDSTGSSKMNEELSQKRADAVRQYLIANKTLTGDHIQSQGFGSSRPLATNETPEGRAINRRIDVIITPQIKPQPLSRPKID